MAGASGAAFDPDATVIVQPQATRSTVTLPGELSQIASEAEKNGKKEPPPVDAPSLDFDLGVSESEEVAPEPEPAPAPIKPAAPAAVFFMGSRIHEIMQRALWSARRFNRLGTPNFSSAYLAVLNVITSILRTDFF